uniref:Uncharacterized protein n=1 Tax=Rhodnius prolixus TaxID=13249 RepID=T1HPH6_RHOPR
MEKQNLNKNNFKKMNDVKVISALNLKKDNYISLNGVSLSNLKTVSTTTVTNARKTVTKTQKENLVRSRCTNLISSKENSELIKINSSPGLQNRTKLGGEIVRKNYKRKITVDKFMNNQQLLQDFHYLNVELQYQPSEKEKEALSNSTLFSNLEKQTLRLNNYSPVLVDTILLQKLTRLDPTSARKLIFNILKKRNDLDGISLELSSNSNKEITVKTKRKNTFKKQSIKKFLISQIYNLLSLRLSRETERLAEILYYLLVKMCLKNKPSSFTDESNNGDIKRLKDKIKEYSNERKEMIKKKLKLREKYGGHNGNDKKGKLGKVKHEKSKKKQKAIKMSDNSTKKLERVKSRMKMSKHDLMRMELVSVDKTQMESTIRDYLARQTNLVDLMNNNDSDETF